MKRKESSLSRIYALNAANMVALTLANIIVVPFYLHYLGIKTYESWVFINAVANICLIFDFGMIFYVSNSARIAYGLGDTQTAERIIGQGLSFMGLLFLPFALVSAAYYAWFRTFESLAFAIMLIGAPLAMLRTWLSYILTARTSQVWELGTFIACTLAQTAALIVTVMLGGGILRLAIVQTVTTVLFGIVPLLFALRHFAPELTLRPRKAAMHECREIVSGSLAQFGYSAAAVAVVHLPVVLLGVIPGLPFGSLAIFTTSRTLSGVVRQFCQQLARSNGIEISRYLAPEHAGRMRRIFMLGSITISSLAAIGMGALLPLADLVLKVWTGKPQLYNPTVIALFCLLAVMSAQVQLPMIIPQFTNRARMMAVPLFFQVLLLTVLGLAGSALFGAPGMVAALGIAEISTLGAVSLRKILPSMGISPLRFLLLSGGPGLAMFIISASIGAAARWLVQPVNAVGLVECGALWGVCILPFVTYLYKAGKHMNLRY